MNRSNDPDERVRAQVLSAIAELRRALRDKRLHGHDDLFHISGGLESRLDRPLDEEVQAGKAIEAAQAHAVPAGPVNHTLVETATSTKTINAWIEEREDRPDEPLVVGNPYALSFKLGDAVAYNLFSGQDTDVAESDIPLEGLMTRWTVVSKSVELRSTSPGVRVHAWPPDSPSSWTAHFTLPVLRDRESDIIRLGIIPHDPEAARLNVLIDVGVDPWREFAVDLVTVKREGEPAPPISPAVKIIDEVILAPADQLNLDPPHEWQTPRGTLTLRMRGRGRIEVTGQALQDGVVVDIEDESHWGGNAAEVANLIPALRSAGEAFRSTEQSYLNDIDHDDLIQRLAQFAPVYDWNQVPDLADERHRDTWKRVASSQTLHRLATIGHALYQRCFPNRQDHPIRGWLDSLPAGYQLNIRWTMDDPGWIPHMPWGLMYMREPTLPIDPRLHGDTFPDQLRQAQVQCTPSPWRAGYRQPGTLSLLGHG